MMNKHSSISNFKTVSRQKQKIKMNPSKSKVDSHPNMSTQMEKGINNLSKPKRKQTKSGNKCRNDNKKPQTAFAKSRNQNKQQKEQYGLDIKSDLKQLINKNNVGKAKNHEIVPQLLKSIEIGCKALKHIHHRQRLFHEKRSSNHSNKTQKSKKQSIQCINNEPKGKLRQTMHLYGKDMKPIAPKVSRFSFQVNQNGCDKMKIEHKLRQNASRKSTQNKEVQKNFIEIYKIYKKSFEIQQIKVGKSNTNTNYNTNQSKNSSSHHNSHCPSRIGDSNLRGKSRQQEKVNIEKIEMIIKNQQKKALEIEADNPLVIEKAYFDQSKEIQSKNMKKQLFSFSVQQEQFSNKSSVGPNLSLLIKQYKSNMAKNLQNDRLFQQRQTQNLQLKKIDNFQKSEEASLFTLQKKFQKSKFYVKPIPQFEQKNKQNMQQSNLQGSEITLIENNVIVDDSELTSLQL